ncbi:hypothetical protein [Cellulomonas fimi]|uniref:hypothetical protein n=1 Tax=Cellulomonas fimi TaxID=1708 RepID=UPI001B85C6DB|nr:hypothetical protein [Cellulomonas fimi]
MTPAPAGSFPGDRGGLAEAFGPADEYAARVADALGPPRDDADSEGLEFPCWWAWVPWPGAGC